MTKKLDLVGRRFGRLVVVSEDGKDSRGNRMLKCLCDCGNYITTRAYSLCNGSCKSCGCLRKEVSSKNNSTHGHSQEKLYGIWRGMIKRCYDPNHQSYERYGGRGITVCDEWLNSYEIFRDFMLANGYDEYGLAYNNTIDRIDNNKGYSPDNCRVTTMKTQALNKSSNHLVTYKGKKMTVTEAAEKNNLTNKQVFNRLDKGWSMSRALNQPLNKTTLYTVSNQTHTVAGWAEIMDVKPHIIRGRLKTHTMQEIYGEWKIQGFLEIGDYSVKLEEANGEKHARREWAKIIGISETTLRKILREHTMQEVYDDWKVNKGRLSFVRCNSLEEANEEAKTRKEWAKTFGMAEKTLRKLLKERTIEDLVEEFNKNGFIKMYSAGCNYYTADGVTECTAWWARKLRVNECTLKNFLKKRSMQEIVNEFNKNGFLKVNNCSPKFHTVDGVIRGQKEWAEILGISPSTLRYKLKKKTMQEIVDELRTT